jgi:hypothetical protein
VKTFSSQCFGLSSATTQEIFLSPQTTVDVRVSAAIFTNNFSLVEGADAGPVRITTPPPPPFPSVLPDGAGFTLTWNPIPGATGYAILRALDSPFGAFGTFAPIGTTLDSTFTDAGPLESWSQYSYQVASIGADGAIGDPSFFGATGVTTGLPDQKNLGTLPIASTRVDFSHDAGQTFVVGQGGFLAGIELSTSASFVSIDLFDGPLAILNDDFVSFNASNCCGPLADGPPGPSFVRLLPFRQIPVSAGQQLRLRVRGVFFGSLDVGRSADGYAGGSYFAAGVPVPGDDLVFKTFVKPVPGPVTVPGFPIAFPGVRRVTLAWQASPNATSYSVLRSSTPDGTFTAIATDLVQAYFVDEPLVPGPIWFYRVRATDAAGNVAETTTPVGAGPLASDVDQANAGDGSGSVVVWDSQFSFAGQSVTIGKTGTLGGIQFTALAAADIGSAGFFPATVIVRDDTGKVLIRKDGAQISLEGACSPAPCGPPPIDPSSPTLQTVDLSASRLAVTAGQLLHFEVHSSFALQIGDSADLYPGGEESVNGIPIPGRDLAFQVLVQ